MKRILLLIILLSLPGMLIFAKGGSEKNKESVMLGISFFNSADQRSPSENALLSALDQYEKVQIVTQTANRNPELQRSQIENIARQGVTVLFVITRDADTVAEAVDTVSAHVSVIAYSSFIASSNLAAYSAFDDGVFENGMSDSLDEERDAHELARRSAALAMALASKRKISYLSHHSLADLTNDTSRKGMVPCLFIKGAVSESQQEPGLI